MFKTEEPTKMTAHISGLLFYIDIGSIFLLA